MKFRMLLVLASFRKWPGPNDLLPDSSYFLDQRTRWCSMAELYGRAADHRPGYAALIWVTQWPAVNPHWLRSWRSYEV